MSIAIDNMFCVMRVINNSNQLMTAAQIADKTFLNVRTVQRHAMRLASEGLVDYKHNGYKYSYMKRGLKV